MKARRLRPAQCRNPEYDRRLNEQRVTEGLEPIPHTLDCPKGQVVHDVSPIMCLGTNPAFEPVDDEGRAAVVKALNSPGRKAELKHLRRMFEVKSQLTPKRRKYVEDLFAKYGPELNGETPAQAVKPPVKE